MMMFKRNHRTTHPTKAELQRINSYYKNLTAEVSDEEMYSVLMPDDLDKPWHLFRLLMLADCKNPLGKTAAIQFAFKLGRMAGERE